jgi:hypothetical protein
MPVQQFRRAKPPRQQNHPIGALGLGRYNAQSLHQPADHVLDIGQPLT